MRDEMQRRLAVCFCPQIPKDDLRTKQQSITKQQSMTNQQTNQTSMNLKKYQKAASKRQQLFWLKVLVRQRW
jgi:hypothetical protein